ncbi:MAG: hypothetical protein ACKO5K_06450 [Armatimonadota bacterium]
MENPDREPPFGLLLLACCMVLVQVAVAMSVRQPLAWGLAAVDCGLAAGLLARQPWARWATGARCAVLLGTTVAGITLSSSRRVAWPPVAVAIYAIAWLAQPAAGRWFRRPTKG